MRRQCPHCEQSAKITHTNKLSGAAVIDEYCQCLNPDCDARFVMSVSHAKDIRPPKKDMDNLMTEFLRKFTREELLQLAGHTC